MTDIRQQLLAAFEAEHRDHLQAIRRALQDVGEADLREVFRRAHSLKGAARAVDLPVVEDLAHGLEAIFSRAMEGELALNREVIEAVHLGLDAVEAHAAAAADPARGPPAAEPVLAALAGALEGRPPSPGELGPLPIPQPQVEPEPEPGPGDAAGAAEPRIEYVRVETEDLARLSRAMHQLSADLHGQEALTAGLRRLQGEARRLQQLWRGDGRVRDPVKARELEDGLQALAREAGALARRQSEVAWSAAEGVRRVGGQIERLTLIPAEQVFGGLGRMVRDIARAEGVAVELRMSGLEAQADRKVLQALKDPVMHLMRNVLSHGVESPDAREAQGKPAPILIGLDVAAEGGRLRVTVYDDGRGPDFARLEAAAIAKGLLPPRAPEEPAPAPDTLLALAFQPGLSTAEEVDRMAGRGMGLSVVAETVRELRGSVRLEARRPWGAEVIVSAPLSTARQWLALVESGDGVFALPSYAIERLLRLKAGALETVDGHPAARIEIDGADVVVPVVSLSALLARPPAEIPVRDGAVNALLVRRGQRRLAIAVDELQDVRGAMVEDLRARALDPALSTGAVLLDDQTPALVLNPDALIDRWLREWRGLASRGLGFAPPPSEPETARTVLVVDDSITTRTLEKSILEAQGYRVLLAVDGLDALNRLRSGEALVDLMLVDVEMPRMDGFALLQAVKADARLASVPVVLMTSRAEQADVRRGLELGADAYLTKQKFDQRELLATIGRLL